MGEACPEKSGSQLEPGLTLPSQSVWVHDLCGATCVTSRSAFIIFYSTSTLQELSESSTSFLRRNITALAAKEPQIGYVIGDQLVQRELLNPLLRLIFAFSALPSRLAQIFAMRWWRTRHMSIYGESIKQEVLRRTLITTFVTKISSSLTNWQRLLLHE